MSVISNTTVLSNFAAIHSLDRLHELFGEVFLPTEVYQEIQRGLEEGYTFYSGIDEILHAPSGLWSKRMTGSSGSSPPAFIPLSKILQPW